MTDFCILVQHYLYAHCWNNNFLADYLRRELEYLTMTTPDKLKEPEDIAIDFNEYLETVSAGLEQLETGVKVIVDNIRTKMDELSIGTDSII